jgi:xylulokinase
MSQKLLLGIDVGSSSIKASLLNADTGELVSLAASPEHEMKINAPEIGWAEQDPNTWWEHVILAVKKLFASDTGRKSITQNYEIIGIGISYQMHGLVLVDKNKKVLYPSIIWCDSRAVEIGQKAFSDLGEENALSTLLNSPGNFTASKLKWVKDNRPDLYSKIHKIMLPGDYIAMKLTDKVRTTISGLSEGIFWNFDKQSISDELINYFGFEKGLLPELVPTFGKQGELTKEAAKELNLKPGIPISYRAGDQPNNALSLNVLNPGEIATTAGTSGVIYAVTDRNLFDPQNRVNTFAHVNYTNENQNKGILLCINGTGIQYSWIKQNILEDKYSYKELNDFASKIEAGSGGILCFPFGNGAERILENKDINCQFSNINFNRHNLGHLIRSAQEGIAFSFRYGLDIMKSMWKSAGLETMEAKVVRAGNSNLFQSEVFREAFVNVCNLDLEIYNTDGSQGAARGAGIGIGYYTNNDEAFKGLKVIDKLKPEKELVRKFDSCYQNWKNHLLTLIKT